MAGVIGLKENSRKIRIKNFHFIIMDDFIEIMVRKN
jgi:hypothetical protein